MSMNNRSINSRIADFRSYDVAARRAEIVRQTDLTEADIAVYDAADGLTIDQADRMVENVLGVIGIPVGVATNFTVNGTDYLIPLATEEPSVVAAASNAARIARGLGGFHVSSTPPIMQAQIQLVDVVDPAAARIRLLEAREEIIALANEQDPKLVSVGGGVKDISVRIVSSDKATYVVLHLHVDVRDAMGANAVNTMAEAIADRVAEIGGGHVVLRILTNKADLRLTRVRAVFDAELIGGAEVVDNLIHAARLAELDPYRAATHNKGIMNGISAVVLATGNDTRAVEAGCHFPCSQRRRNLLVALAFREECRRKHRRHPRATHAGRPRRRGHQSAPRSAGRNQDARRRERRGTRRHHPGSRPGAEPGCGPRSGQ